MNIDMQTFSHLIAIVSIIISIAAIIIVIYSKRSRVSDINLSALFKDSLPLIDMKRIEESINLYIKPDCQYKDPFLFPDDRRFGLFEKMDDFLFNDDNNRTMIITGDSGIGKTSFLINYFVKFKFNNSTKLRIILHTKDINSIKERIYKLKYNPASYILFWDSIDTCLSDNWLQETNEIRNITNIFYKTVITCNKPYFKRINYDPKYLPKSTEQNLCNYEQLTLIRNCPRAIGDKKEYGALVLYISPFNELQKQLFVNKKFGKRNKEKIKETMSYLDSIIPELSKLPMILSSLDLLLKLKKENIFEIYNFIIDLILERELGYNENKNDYLVLFSSIAFEMFTRKADSIPISLINDMALRNKIDFTNWIDGKLFLKIVDNSSCVFTFKVLKEYFLAKYYILNNIEMSEEVIKEVSQHFIITQINNET